MSRYDEDSGFHEVHQEKKEKEGKKMKMKQKHLLWLKHYLMTEEGYKQGGI